jgi:hypothetical protein
MQTNRFRLFLITLMLGLAAPMLAWAASPAEVAAQARDQWAKARVAYLDSIKPHAADPLVAQYTAALDKAGKSLENYLALKTASPAPKATALTPAVDQLVKDLAALRVLQGKAKGSLATALGGALAQHNQVTQTALKNMR